MKPAKLSEDLQPVTGLKSQGPTLVKQVNDTGRPVVLTKHGKGIAVLMSLEVYEELQERLDALELQQAVAEGIRDAEAGNLLDHEEVKARVFARLRGE